MPLTAKFSKEFYDRLGHEVTDELVNWLNQVDATYRTELRNLNDLNFQRFDAKLEQRVTQLDVKWDQRFAQMDAKWDRLIAELDRKWERKFAALDGKWERRFATLEQSLARMDARLTWRLFLFWVGTLATLITLLKL